jgi:Flp pilus assembly protein TadG
MDMVGFQPQFGKPRGRRAVALVYLTVLLTILLGLVSFAIDLGMLRFVKGNLQTTVDAATRAGCTGLQLGPAEVRARAKAIAASNTVNGAPLTLLDSDIELGTWEPIGKTFTPLSGAAESTANAVRITGHVSAARGNAVRLMFLPLIGGASSAGMTAKSTGSVTVVSEEIVIVQDVSGSFYNEIGLARAGDQDLLDSLNATGNSSMGLVAFTGTAVTVSPLKTVPLNYTALKNAVTSLDVGTAAMPSIYTGTDIAAGIEQAQSVFNLYPQTSANRSMVIVSDGEPQPLSGNAHPGLSAAQLLTLAQQRADTAWAGKINVYVVFWDSANNPTAAANIKTLIRGKGQFVHVTDPSQLAEAVRTILYNVKVVK